MTDNELPDFNDMQAQADAIYSCSITKGNLDLQIKVRESEITKEVTTNTNYWVGGKIPSVAYIEATYLTTGLENELKTLREQYVVASAELERARLYLEIMKAKIDVWRSKMASERITLTS